ncbi:MAG: hypothetical protein ACO25Q_06900 [Sediminibacterium sp.]
MQYFIIFALVIAIVIGGPIASIWSLNALFNLTIPVTIETWLASFWLTSILGSSIIKTKAK